MSDLDLKMNEIRSLLEDGNSNPPEYITLNGEEWSAIRDVYISSMRAPQVPSISFKSGATITGSFSDKSPLRGCELSFVDEVSLLPCDEEALASLIDSIHNKDLEDAPAKLPDWLEERLSMKDGWEDR